MSNVIDRRTVKLSPNTEEWIEWRKGGIGASDAPSVMGASPYVTAFELWQEKTGRRVRESNDYVLTQGHEVETKVRALYEMDKGEDFGELLVEWEAFPFIRASLDGINKDRTKAVEIKMVGKDRFESGELPEHFKIQATQQMLVTGLDEITFLFARQPNKAKGIKVDGYKEIVYKRDDALMKELFEALKKFWKAVQDDKPPAKTDKDKPEETNDRIKGILTKWAAADKRAKEAKKKADDIKKELSEKVPEGAICHGFELSWTTRKGSVDYSKVPELKGVDVEPYRKDGTRSFGIKKQK